MDDRPHQLAERANAHQEQTEQPAQQHQPAWRRGAGEITEAEERQLAERIDRTHRLG